MAIRGRQFGMSIQGGQFGMSIWNGDSEEDSRVKIQGWDIRDGVPKQEFGRNNCKKMTIPLDKRLRRYYLCI